MKPPFQKWSQSLRHSIKKYIEKQIQESFNLQNHQFLERYKHKIRQKFIDRLLSKMSNTQQTTPAQTNPQQIEQHKENNNQADIDNEQENNQAQGQAQMELQNQANQAQNDQGPANNEDPQDGEQGQIEEQQNPSERQQPVQNSPEQNPAQQISIDKDRYINKLETYLNRVKADLQNKSKEFNDLSEENKKTKQSLKKIRFEFLSSKQQISALNQQQSGLQKQSEHLQKLNQQFMEQIKTYKEAGDINFYKNKIIELQKLLQVQKKELEMKSTMIDQKDELQSTISSTSKSKVQILALIEKYESQNRQLAARHAEVCLVNAELEKTRQKLQMDVNELKIRVAESQESLTVEKEKVFELEEQIKKSEEDFQQKLRQSQQSMAQLLSNQTISPVVEQNIVMVQSKIIKSPLQQYGIKILSPVQQRNMIMREFIQLQIKHQSVIQELSNLRQRHYQTLRQIKNMSTTHVSKKDYSQLYKKYSKLRKCLQNSLINEENIRKELLKYTTVNDQSAHTEGNNLSQGEQARDAFSRYKSLLLEEPENALNKVEKIIEKSSESQKQLFTLKQQLETKQRLIKTDKLLKQKDQKIQTLQKQITKYKNIIQLYDTQLTYKNNEIELLRKHNQQTIQRIYELQKNHMPKELQHQLTSQIEEKRILNEILQIKNIQALKENNMLKNQKQILTELYTDLKKMYEEILNRQPQLEQEQNKPQEQREKNIMEIENQPCKQCMERQQKHKQINFSQVQSQTEGLTEIYFKEIKQLLTILRKFPKKVDTVTGQLEAQKLTIHEVKKRYDQAMQSYRTSLRQLEEEKKANDQWRSKQKEEIREEFQQVRQLLLNERLITALRKAKSLIDFYEKSALQAEGEQNLEEGDQEEGVEKNEVVAQKNEVIAQKNEVIAQKNEGNVQMNQENIERNEGEIEGNEGNVEEPIEQEKQNQ